MLRDGALADRRVITAINTFFIPVWINVREQVVPSFPARARVLIEADVDDEGRVSNLFSNGFFLRSVVLSPADLRLLNPQAETVVDSSASFAERGHFAYAQFNSSDYLAMLQEALDNY